VPGDSTPRSGHGHLYHPQAQAKAGLNLFQSEFKKCFFLNSAFNSDNVVIIRQHPFLFTLDLFAQWQELQA